ncbi:MAG TPA: signal peptidase II [Lachnospiraceae bacterium]|nr:signal peptidase II [Lachnospiraceae bacterium]
MMIICIFLILTIFALDYLIKKKIENDKNLPRSFWKGRVYIQKYHNKGAFWNLGEKYPKVVMFVSLLMTGLIFILFLLSFGQKGNGLLQLGLAAVLGGAFSNTYDRLKQNYVVDYVSFQVKWKHLANTVFNISDFFIMTGALMSCLGSLRMK